MRILTRSTHAAVIMVALAVAATFVHAQRSQSAWPPPLKPADEASPVLSPQDEMKTFVMPPGYHVELVASEPLVSDPVLMDWDQDGRLWVIEMPGYMPGINPSNDQERVPTGRIVVLEDTNHDGVMDKRTVFLDKLVLPRALKVLDKGVLVGEPPNLWFVHDENRDLKPEAKDLVTNTYGTLAASPEHNANGLMWGLDNWMHTSEHDGYLRYKDFKFETARTLSRGQWGGTQDDFGRIYRNTNEAALFVDFVSEKYYTRSPTLLRTRGLYDSLENRIVNTVWPAHVTPGVNRGYQAGVLKADGTLAAFTSTGAPTVYRGDRLPSELAGNVFVIEPAANLVARLIVSDDGSSLVAKKAYEQGEFLASTHERFRPVYLSSAPDGTLYVLDLYRGIIQHRNYVTEYLRDHIVSNKLEQPTSYGRIFRVVHDTTRRGPAPAMSRATSAQLVGYLSHPNGWWRDTAQRLLVERGDRGKATVAALIDRALRATDARTRLHALWTLDGLDAIDPATVTKALADPSRDVRASAVRLSERWLNEPGQALQSLVLARMDDKDWAVRRQVAATLGELPKEQKEPAIATMLAKYGDDAVVVDAAISGARGSEAAILAKLLEAPAEDVKVTNAITMVAGTIVRGGQDASVQQVFAVTSDASVALWKRSAVLRGAEVALLSAAMPGTPARATVNPAVPGAADTPAPCATCPGGRQGPGGASAFMTPAGPPTTVAAVPGGRAGGGGGRGGGGAGGGRGGGGPMLRIAREPALATMAPQPGNDLATRAAAVLGRVEWPGKPGVTAITPLTPDEQRRFAAGAQVYQSLCQACHQSDGRGRDKLAPALVGSPFALAPGNIPARILLGGKEGTVGLMPPLGAVLTDDQIADVLTYVRREWGQTASPVDAATIKDIRAQTTGRARPWTNDELTRLMGSTGGGFHQ